MVYVLPCNLPNFQQSAPRGDEWKFVDEGSPHGAGQVTWRNVDTGETIICPAIWYTFPAKRYAATLRWNADRSEENALRKLQEDVPETLRNLKPWDITEAEQMRRQARRLRAMAMLCDRNPDAPAGAIDFRGLSDPITPRDVEDSTVAAIEAEASA